MTSPGQLPASRLLVWLIAAAVVGGLIWLLSDALLPFVAGLIIAYLLDPLVDRVERLGLGRVAATLTIVFLAIVTVVLLILLVVPLLVSEFGGFVQRFPEYMQRLQELIRSEGGWLLARVGGEEAFANLQRSLGDLIGQGAGFAGRFFSSLWTGGRAVLNVLSLIVVTPVVAVYLLLDWDRMIASVDSWLPRPQHATIRRLTAEMDQAMAGFLRGQGLVCLILGSAYALTLSLIGLNFALLIGLGAGLIGFIPFVGSITGFVAAMSVAIVQFWPDPTFIIATFAIFVGGQFIEGNILQPKLIGASVGLHPVWLMFALFAFGSLFGFLGLLLATPLAAAIGVLVRHALSLYLASPLYAGRGPDLRLD